MNTLLLHYTDSDNRERTIFIKPSDNSSRTRSIMGDNTLTLYFESTEPIDIPVGSWVVPEQLGTERYELTQPANIKKIHNRYFEYTLVMEGEQAKLKKYMFREVAISEETGEVMDAPQRLKFSLTAKPQQHLKMLIDNLNLREGGWTVGECVEAVEQVISYNHTTCWDALNMIAEAFNTEWEVVGKAIHLRKVEYNKDNPLPLSYGRGNGFRSGVGRVNPDGSNTVERLFVQGSEQNINASEYGSPELLLPKGQQLVYEGRTYETDENGYSIHRAGVTPKTQTEDSLDCSHIYPSRTGIISRVDVVDAPISDNPDNKFYDFYDKDIPDDLDFVKHLIPGETLTVIFQDGMLAGKEFEVKYKHAEKKFEVVPQELDGRTMPDSVFCPVVGQKYAVFGMMMPPHYICDNNTQTGASWDMFREAVKYFYEHEEPHFTFNGELDGIWAKKDWINIGGKIRLGGYILFSDNDFQKEGIAIRITGITDYLNNPYNPSIELSNIPVGGTVYGQLKKIEENEVVTDGMNKEARQFTKRRFRDAKETMSMLERSMLDFTGGINPVTVNTMMMLVGEEGLQFYYSEPSDTFRFDPEDDKTFKADAGTITHKTLKNPAGYLSWEMPSYRSGTLSDPSKGYFVYAKVGKSGDENNTFMLTETALAMNGDPDYYYLLAGILNSEFEGERSFAQMYGYTEILPGRITTDRIVSADGDSYLDLANSAMRLADKGYTKGMDWNETEPNQLTIKGAVNAEQAVLGGFKIDNEKIQSLKQTGGRPNILLDGTNGTANITGRFESNSEGGKVVIDPEERAIKLVGPDARSYGEWRFDGERPGISIGNGLWSLYSLLDSEHLLFNIGRPPVSWYDGGGFYLAGGALAARWDNSINAMRVTMRNLPTTPTNLQSGDLWRDANDNNRLKVIP